LMTFAPMQLAPRVPFYRVGFAVSATYTSAQADVPHPPPRPYA